MKSKLFNRIRERIGRNFEQDIFSRIRFRLTFTYSSLLMLFLLVFTVIVVAVLFFIVTREQFQELQAQTDQEVIAYQNHTEFPPSDPRFFSFEVNLDGKIVVSDQVIPGTQDPILQKVSGWIPQKNETRYVTVRLRHDRDMNLIMTGRILFEGNKQVGILYSGTDVTYYWHIYSRLIEILVGLSFVFIIIAAFVGQFMAKRAMTPITNSFTKQQEFVADASHELRTPLSVLYSSLEVLEIEEGGNLSDFSQNVMEDMKDEVRSMGKLVSNLLTLARSDSGALEILSEKFNLTSIVDKLIRSLQPLAIAHSIELEVHAPETLMITGDSERIKQLLYILLDNAIKYISEKGKVILSLSTEWIEQQETCCIRIEDTGIGIPIDQQTEIFERFYRVDKNRSRKMGGTGLGLAIAKWIVEAHHGKIEVVSTPGIGSVFTVLIPLSGKQS